MHKKVYWKGIEELQKLPHHNKNTNKASVESPLNQEKNNDSLFSRRDFLKLMGFSVAATSLANCEAPIRKAIPYLNKPIDVDPGIPNYYASTYTQNGDYCSIVVKTREGRPIKIEGNNLCPLTQGGVNAQVEASVLSLYDQETLQYPQKKQQETTWNNLDHTIIEKFNHIQKNDGQIRIISHTIISPSTQQAIKNFKKKYPNTQHVVYDTTSYYGIRQANQEYFQQAIIPAYHFDKAQVIVSFGADFLGTWLSPIAFTKQYSKMRKVSKQKKYMSKHYQLEANLSLSGANADCRIPIHPHDEGIALICLYNILAKKMQKPIIATEKKLPYADHLKNIAQALWENRKKSLVVSGSNNTSIQILTNSINHLLGNYGHTIDLTHPNYTKQGNDKDMLKFVQELQQKKIQGIIFFNANPVYNHPQGKIIAQNLDKVDLTIATNSCLDETASLVQYNIPDHHYLASWNDACPQKNIFSLTQPTITPIFKTRSAPESLLIWADAPIKNYYQFVQTQWKNNFFHKQKKFTDFQKFWDHCLYNGVYPLEKEPTQHKKWQNLPLTLIQSHAKKIDQKQKKSLTLVFYEKIGIGNGMQANNPWLQEMPDPITKVCWDNYITIAQKMAKKYHLEPKEGKAPMVQLKVGKKIIQAPVIIQPGQHENTLGIAMGYGRTKGGKVANKVGINIFPWIQTIHGNMSYTISDILLTPLKKYYPLAQTQTHETYMGRENIIQETTLAHYQKNSFSGKPSLTIATSHGNKKPDSITLWKGHMYPNHHWGLVIDMNTCTGCSACTIACQAENNVPVVGKEEVINRREMHWIRIDRYYSSNATKNDIEGLAQAAENPEVSFQPMMCQHCNNAPCETVCPVLATTHSAEGLNQMTYNRCIGTRYCANNCPYKVRRFNWFKYHDNKKIKDNTAMNNSLGKMVLNPDVTVRARGVMEKCSLCIQRIQEGKLKAKLQKRKLLDNDIDTACATACPSDAIVFGDMNNPESKIYKILNQENTSRAYHVLEEIRTQPNVTYLRKVRNK